MKNIQKGRYRHLKGVGNEQTNNILSFPMLTQKKFLPLLFSLLSCLFLTAQTWKASDLKFCTQLSINDWAKVQANKTQSLIEGDKITFKGRKTVASSQWVKKQPDRNCLSANPDDCLVWCLVEVPGENTPDKTYLLSAVEQINGQWIEPALSAKLYKVKAVCTESVSVELKIATINALLEVGAYRKQKRRETTENYIAYCDEHFFEALKKFQTDNDFPVGEYYDLESLVALEVVKE
ncbi:MAG: hypothetical protein RLZZ292_2914 [Bacteroidota bacterium]